MATELPNQVATGNEASTRSKFSRVNGSGHSRSSPPSSSARGDSATTTIQYSGNSRRGRGARRRRAGPGASGRGDGGAAEAEADGGGRGGRHPTRSRVRLVRQRTAVNDQAHDEQDDADRRGVALVADDEPVVVGVGDEHRRRVARAAPGEDEDDVEHLEGVDDVHDEEEERRRAEHRHGDVAEPLPAVGAVEPGGLVELGPDALQTGEVDEHVEARCATTASRGRPTRTPRRRPDCQGIVGQAERARAACRGRRCSGRRPAPR